MWWFQGLFTMVFAFAITLVMLGSSLAGQASHRSFFVKLFAIMAAIEVVLIGAAVVFIYLAETGAL